MSSSNNYFKNQFNYLDTVCDKYYMKNGEIDVNVKLHSLMQETDPSWIIIYVLTKNVKTLYHVTDSQHVKTNANTDKIASLEAKLCSLEDKVTRMEAINDFKKSDMRYQYIQTTETFISIVFLMIFAIIIGAFIIIVVM